MTLGMCYAAFGLLAGLLLRVADKPPPRDPAASIGYTYGLPLIVLAGVLRVLRIGQDP